MKTDNLTEVQRQRYLRVQELAQENLNLTTNLVEPHLNPYRDISSMRLAKVEALARDAFMSALPTGETLVMLAADDKIKSSLSLDYALREKTRGTALKLKIKNAKWFENNWNIFAGDLGFGARRSIFVFFELKENILAKLISAWWDPDVLLNPHVASSRSLLNQVKAQIKPGSLVFSLSLIRLRSCQLYFHKSDAENVTRIVCASTHKTKWWK